VWALNRRGRTDILVTDFLEPAKRWNGVVPLDSGRDSKRRNLAPLKFTDYVEADVFRARIQSDPRAFGQFGSVFHLGACSATTERNESYLRTTISPIPGSRRMVARSGGALCLRFLRRHLRRRYRGHGRPG